MANTVSSLADLASVKMGDIPDALPLLPRGTYMWEIIEVPEIAPTQKGYGEMLNHKCKLIAPHDDFENPDELDEYTAQFGDPKGSVRSVGIYFPTSINPESKSEKSLDTQQMEAQVRIKRFYSKVLGIEAESIPEAVSMARGARFYGMIDHEPHYQDASRNVERFEDRNCAAI